MHGFPEGYTEWEADRDEDGRIIRAPYRRPDPTPEQEAYWARIWAAYDALPAPQPVGGDDEMPF